MNVSYYQNIKDIIGQKRRYDYLHYLNDIKNLKWKREVDLLRTATDKDLKNKLKSNLPNITFAGTFRTRNDDHLEKASGLAILDFDKLNNLREFKESLKNDKLIHCCFISPSGNGLKALIKIPIVINKEEYKAIYKQIIESYPTLDVSNSNVSRTCFVSYDDDLYLNLESETFLPDYSFLKKEDDFREAYSNVPVTSENEIVQKLLKWFSSKYNSAERNNSIYKLARAFNDFGVDKFTAQPLLYAYQQKGFNANEIDNIINSAYKHKDDFGKKQFEDVHKIKQIKNLLIQKKKDDDIVNQYPELNSVGLRIEIENLKAKIDFDEFWELRGNKMAINPYKFKLKLEDLDYGKYYPNHKSKVFIFVKKDGNFYDIITEFQIKDHVLNELIKSNKIDGFNLVADDQKLFTNRYLSMINTYNIEIEKDTADYGMIYYKNLAVRVYKDEVKLLSYEDLNGYVWKSNVIDRDYKEVDHHESQFRSFIWYACGESVEKYNTMKSVIGYLLHGFKTSANNRAMILNDETISDNPNGGSGKGIIINSLSHMKKISVIDGKTFDFNKSFAFQTVNTDTQILAFDDVRKNFDFERLFSVITEGLTIEYKGQDAIKIPVKDSPKIIISTNYTVKAEGGSFERRIFEVEMSDYFNANNTPFDKFGNLLFDEWDEEEWARFDKFMINCLQYYLANGLVKSETKNLVLRKFINETSQEFYEFSIKENSLNHNQRLVKGEIFDRFVFNYPDFKKWIKTNTFNKWVKKYAAFKGLEYKDGNSNGQRWFIVEDGNGIVINENGMPF